MSDFIDGKISVPHQNVDFAHKSHKVMISCQENSTELIKDQILKNLNKIMPTLTTEYLIQDLNQSHSNIVNIRLSLSNCRLQSLKVLINVKINLSKRSFQSVLTVLEGQTPYKIQSSSKRILVCKLFCKSSAKSFNKMSVSLSEGSIKVLKPITYFCQQDFHEFLIGKFKEKSFTNYIKKTLNQGIQVLKPVLRQLIEDFEEDPNDIRLQAQQIIKRQIFRYILKSTIEPSFEVSFGSGKYEMMQCLAKEEIFDTNWMTQNIVTDFEEFNSHCLYLNPKVPLESFKKLYVRQYFSSNDEELTQLKTKIQPPVTRLNFGFESKYVYNMIEQSETNKINLRKINGGGFSQISVAEVEFWYLLTAGQKRLIKMEDLKKEKEEVVTHVKVKKQNKKILVFKSNRFTGTQQSRNRIDHEMRIVEKFKGTPSIFIPQYFKIANQASPFANYLIMQHLPYPTLNEYVEIHKNSISFLTKINLACLIVHTLQTIKNNGIVHMDLKPSNIIVGKRMIVKLFDFGESYNKQICGENYKPAFSNPYGCPQVVDNEGKMQFTEKSDIYSWGVLVWELLFKRYPFYLPIQKTVEVLKNKNYDQYIYFAPEDEGQYGSWEIMPLVRSTLLKAMDQNLKNRPFTIWLTVILKECLSHLINLECNSSNG